MTNETSLIETDWYRLQETGVEFYGEPPSFDAFQEAVLFWTRLNRLSTWVLADLARFGERVYGETYTQVIAATGLSLGRISNIVSVANHIPVEERRALPFGHHATVAYMEKEERGYWLDKAEAEGLTREELRGAIRAKKAVPNNHKDTVLPDNNSNLVKEDSGLNKLGCYDLIVEYVRANETAQDTRSREVYAAMKNLVRNSL